MYRHEEGTSANAARVAAIQWQTFQATLTDEQKALNYDARARLYNTWRAKQARGDGR